MTRKRTNIIWTLPKEELKKLLDESKSYKDFFTRLGLPNHGAYPRSLKIRLKNEKIEPPHYEFDYKGLLDRIRIEIPIEKMLVEKSNAGRSCLKKKLLKQGLIKNQCAVCKIDPYWCGEKLNMVLDHVNGINDDNRLENLRLLCPNCNSQTPTFGGRNRAKKKGKALEKITCPMCGEKRSRGASLCAKCENMSKRRVDRPDKECLAKMLWEKPTQTIAKEFGVSDKAVEKWAIAYSLTKPSRGYWAKVKNNSDVR
jgi:hypothetical protein